METQLAFDNTNKQLQLCFKERFRTDQGITLKVRGALNTVTGHVDSLLKLGTGSSDFRQRSSRRARRGEKPIFEFAKPELRLGGAYVPGKDELMYGLVAKQKAFVGPFGLKAKAAVNYPMRSQQGYAVGDVRLSHTVYRFTDMQDLRVVLGCGGSASLSSTKRSFTESLAPYGIVRENNWTLQTNFQGKWAVRYDL